MEVIIHLIFQVIKIAIQATLYGYLFLKLFSNINKSDPHSWFQKITANKRRFRFLSRILISITLFIWMFSYWGDHGLGDHARIPIGNGKSIEQINGTMSYIRPSGHEFETYSINSYSVKGSYCVGQKKNKSSYFVWDLESNIIQTLKSKDEYYLIAKKLNLPDEYKFVEFWEGYKNFWGTWRFWLLP